MTVRKVAGSKNVRIVKKSGWWIFSTYIFDVPGTRWMVEMDHAEYQRVLDELAQQGAILLQEPYGQPKRGRNLWWTNDGLFWADADLPKEEVLPIIQDRQRKHQARLDRLRRAPSARQREHIPRDVQALVWKRDNGRCVRCGV